MNNLFKMNEIIFLFINYFDICLNAKGEGVKEQRFISSPLSHVYSSFPFSPERINKNIQFSIPNVNMNFVVFRKTGNLIIKNTPKFLNWHQFIPIKRASPLLILGSIRKMSDQKMNRLSQEKSPYLLQHSTNPVDWYPWGEEAFQKAKELNRPIFLSVGYSTCHWCHVMEHESFENEGIAKILNENFVSIKVDREERPDVDKLYMSFVQSLTGGGGWPMSVFLTPNLEPITGGTYFPPADSYGRLGFPTVLKMIAEKWKNNGAEMREQGRELAAAIREGVQQKSSKNIPNAEEATEKCFEWLCKKFDSKNGGFGAAPKFPKAVDLDFLLFYYANKKETEEAKKALEMLQLTFGKMFEGGIHDHIGKGFHRYSVDSIWRVPHFEKMLYDQGQLLRSYSNFNKITGQFGDAILDIFEYIQTNLTHPLGGFYSAEDADSLPKEGASKKKEGAFCVWTKEEVENILGDRPCRHNENICLDEIAEAVFQIMPQGNVPSNADPHGELTNQNVLHLVDETKMEEIAKENKMTKNELAECILDVKRFLAEGRKKRPKPHLDNKIITAWNGLAISGICAAAQAFPEKLEFVESAEKAVKFIRQNLFQNGELLRSVYVDEQNDGKIVQINSPIRAFADDYAFLIEALLDLYSLNFDETLLELANELQEKMDTTFWDEENNSGYFMSRADDHSIISRMQDEQDGAEPCANSVAISNLLRLSAILNSKQFKEKAEYLVRGADQRIEKYPFILPKMLISLNALANPPIQIILVGQSSDEKTKGMLRTIQSKFIPLGTVIFIDKDKKDKWLVAQNDHLKDYEGAYKLERPCVFICKEMACEMPLYSIEELKKKLDEI